MDHYTLIIYRPQLANNSLEHPEQLWIRLVDNDNQESHIFSFVPGDYFGKFGGCGLFRKKEFLPDIVMETTNISVSKATYQEMVEEGDSLHNQFILYDDFDEIPAEQYQ